MTNPPDQQCKALVLEPNGTLHKIYSLDYEDIANAVGGFIQFVPAQCLGHDATMYVNEEGIRLGLEENPWAMRLIGPGAIFGTIRGNLWIAGPTNAEGEETDIPFDLGCEVAQVILREGGTLALSGRERVLLPPGSMN